MGKGLDYKLKRKLSSVYSWYHAHLTGLTDSNRVYLLTDSLKSKQDYVQMCGSKNEMKMGIITMEDFITMNSARHPELVNYMGFA